MIKFEKLGNIDKPYLIRFIFDLKIFSIRFHYWTSSDDLRHFHDHEWNFMNLILHGSYVDISPDSLDLLSPGDFRYRKATHQHSVMIISKSVLSLMICGPRIRTWGFWVNNKFKKRNKYFFMFGHH